MYSQKKKGMFHRNKLIQQAILVAVLVGTSIFAFLHSNFLLKVLAAVALSVITTIIVANYIMEYLYTQGYNMANIINEMLYLFVGIPITVIATTYLPLSIYILFWGPEAKWLRLTMYILVGVLQLGSITYLIKKHLRDKGMKSLRQYFKYMFDAERRRKEQERQAKRSAEIDDFYSRLHKVEEKMEIRKREQTAGFVEFDWKQRLEDLKSSSVDIIVCPSCGYPNDKDAEFCERCGTKLHKK